MTSRSDARSEAQANRERWPDVARVFDMMKAAGLGPTVVEIRDLTKEPPAATGGVKAK